MKVFLRKYELKKLTYKEIISIYEKHAFEPAFKNTLKSAIFLLLAPALTNIYYTFRPNSVLSRHMPFIMPLIAVTQYLLIFRNDMENFCFEEGEDSEVLREKYKILATYELKSKRLLDLQESIESVPPKPK